MKHVIMIWEHCTVEISAIQTIKIGSESREGTTDCEGGTYFTHWVVICQAFALNYSDLISVLLMRKLSLSGSVAHLFTAFQGRGRAA